MRSIFLALLSVVCIASAGAQPASAPEGSPHALSWTDGVDYTYDGAGNIKRMGTDVQVYDAVGRLIQSETNGMRRDYRYDAFGNRLACTDANGSDCQYGRQVTSTSNQLSAATYDPAGNLTHFDGHTYAYDAFNMQTRDEVDGTAFVREYIYTADDERIAVYVPGTGSWHWSLREASGKVLREMTSTDPPAGTGTMGTASWSWVKDYVYRDGLLVASRQIEPGAATPTTYHYHLDHLGTPRQITDDSGRIVGAHSYHAFGPEPSDGRKEEPSPTRLKYTGHERDPELDYMHARYYDPRMGRFLSVDPTWESADLSKPQSWNRYSYVLNNPVNGTDPDGRLGVLDPEILRELHARVIGEASKFVANYVLPDGHSDNSTDADRPDLAKAATSGAVLTAYQVGTVDQLRAMSVTGDNLDIHHAPQAKPAGQVIKNYDPATAPGMAVPKPEHQNIPTQKGSYTGSARDLVAKDVRDLRNHTKAPNSAIRKLVTLVKDMFPEAMKKLF